MYTKQIRTFGALGYSPERIANILGLASPEREDLISRIRTPGDPYHIAYLNGSAIEDYNIDAELAKQAESGDTDAIECLEARKKERIHLDLKRKLFGL